MKSKNLVSSLLALALASLCGVSQAESVNFTGFANGSETVTITLTSPNTAVTKTVSAGGFATILNGGPSFESYCVDVYQTIAFNTTYTDYAFATLTHLFTNNAIALNDLGRLYNTAGVVDTAIEEAAFQIAVWEIAYEASGTAYNVLSGKASFSGGTAASSGALALANTWVMNLAASIRPVSVLDSREHQDVIFAPTTTVFTVPEPEIVLLMAAGLLGVGAAARRKKAKSQA